jgi:hypothetical protein
VTRYGAPLCEEPIGQQARMATVDQVVLSPSTDGGSTWSAPALVSETPHSADPYCNQAFTPTVAVAADGTRARQRVAAEGAAARVITFQ